MVFNVKDGDLGWYTCLASVIGFGEISQEVALFKKGLDRILNPNQTLVVLVDKVIYEISANFSFLFLKICINKKVYANLRSKVKHLC